MWVYVCIDCWIASWFSERWLFFMVHQSYLLYLLVCDDSDNHLHEDCLLLSGAYICFNVMHMFCKFG